MIDHQDDTIKPSRLNRRCKQKSKIGNLIEIGLTECAFVAILPLSIHRSTGRGNPRNKGEKSPQPYVAFLCASFSAALCRVHSVMAGLFGQPQGWPAPLSGISTPLKSVAHAVESMIGGYYLYKGVTA